MRIEIDEDFSIKLGNIIRHIAEDKTGAAIVFQSNLLKSIKELSNFQYKYRRSIYFDDENIRDIGTQRLYHSLQNISRQKAHTCYRYIQ